MPCRSAQFSPSLKITQACHGKLPLKYFFFFPTTKNERNKPIVNGSTLSCLIGRRRRRTDELELVRHQVIYFIIFLSRKSMLCRIRRFFHFSTQLVQKVHVLVSLYIPVPTTCFVFTFPFAITLTHLARDALPPSCLIKYGYVAKRFPFPLP